MVEHCVFCSYTIKEVMEQFESNHERVAIVLSETNKVCGVLSQGDIIRALASDISVYSNVSVILKPSFLYIHSKDMEQAYRLFRSKKITLLPIVNEKFELLDIVTLEDIFEYLEAGKNES